MLFRSIKVNLVFKKEYGYVGFRKNSTWKHKAKFEKEFNEEITKLKNNGVIDNILKFHIKSSEKNY